MEIIIIRILVSASFPKNVYHEKRGEITTQHVTKIIKVNTYSSLHTKTNKMSPDSLHLMSTNLQKFWVRRASATTYNATSLDILADILSHFDGYLFSGKVTFFPSFFAISCIHRNVFSFWIDWIDLRESERNGPCIRRKFKSYLSQSQAALIKFCFCEEVLLKSLLPIILDSSSISNAKK